MTIVLHIHVINFCYFDNLQANLIVFEWGYRGQGQKGTRLDGLSGKRPGAKRQMCEGPMAIPEAK